MCNKIWLVNKKYIRNKSNFINLLLINVSRGIFMDYIDSDSVNAILSVLIANIIQANQ